MFTRVKSQFPSALFQFAGLGLEGRDHTGQRGGGRGGRGGGRYIPPHLRNRLEDAPQPPPGKNHYKCMIQLSVLLSSSILDLGYWVLMVKMLKSKFSDDNGIVRIHNSSNREYN